MSNLLKNVKETVKKEFGCYPEKVLQFGEGNFLRAFADWMIDMANEEGYFKGSIVLCQPIAHGMSDIINSQDGIYTVVMRGTENNKPIEKTRKITSISRCINPYEDYQSLLSLATSPELEIIISNTTEAGISYQPNDKLTDTPPTSYPAKLCAFLYKRYQFFNGDETKGMLILPVELIDNNGSELKRIVLQYAKEWQLENTFIDWLNECNEFTSTLVDRIVTGYPRDNVKEFEDKLGYKDNLLDTCELFNLWVIQGNKKWQDKLPIHKTSAHVLWTDNVVPYKKRKVRILNGSHTAVVPCAFLAGFETVLEFFNDPIYGNFERQLINDEIIPAVDLPNEELVSFANAVLERFNNPFIKHHLIDITLNNCSKFNARCIPTIKDYYYKKQQIPAKFAFSLAGFIRFYDITKVGDHYVGHRDNGENYSLKDDPNMLNFFANEWANNSLETIVHHTLSNTDLWPDGSLCSIDGLESEVLHALQLIVEKGMTSAIKNYLN